MTPGSVTYHYHLDHLGTPRLVTSAGTEVAFHTYTPFGAELSTAPVESPKEVLKFTGHEFDDLGTVYSTYYMHARSDSATLGRFLSPDAIRGVSSRPQSWARRVAASIPVAIPRTEAASDWKVVVTSPAALPARTTLYSTSSKSASGTLPAARSAGGSSRREKSTVVRRFTGHLFLH
jgi:RHS repeat-associated protein